MRKKAQSPPLLRHILIGPVDQPGIKKHDTTGRNTHIHSTVFFRAEVFRHVNPLPLLPFRMACDMLVFDAGGVGARDSAEAAILAVGGVEVDGAGDDGGAVLCAEVVRVLVPADGAAPVGVHGVELGAEEVEGGVWEKVGDLFEDFWMLEYLITNLTINQSTPLHFIQPPIIPVKQESPFIPVPRNPIPNSLLGHSRHSLNNFPQLWQLIL